MSSYLIITFDCCQVELTGSDIFQVKKGDRYGFTWLELGVIDFDVVTTSRYCENAQMFNVGQTASLVDNRYGKRDYSIRLQFTDCSQPAPTECGTLLCVAQLQPEMIRYMFL